jgi:hypothetical protein
MDFSKQRLYRVLRWSGDSAAFVNDGHDPATDVEETDDLDTADVVSSVRKGLRGFTSKHMVMFDLDVPIEVIPSSTPGHSHVYFPETNVSESALFALFEHMVNCGIVEPGYLGASRARGFAALRLPWVRKDGTRLAHLP